MPRREVRVVVLYEDKAHDSFLRKLVKNLRLEPVRFEKCVDSTGVLRRLATEVDALRAEKHQKNLGLVVCIDADEKGLDGRIAELKKRIHDLTQDGARAEGERIALVVPALEIENWYVHLCSPAARPVDETRDYKPSPEWRELVKNLGASSRRAADAWTSGETTPDPLSMAAARIELRRVS
jgi:hypothetical protein